MGGGGGGSVGSVGSGRTLVLFAVLSWVPS